MSILLLDVAMCNGESVLSGRVKAPCSSKIFVIVMLFLTIEMYKGDLFVRELLMFGSAPFSSNNLTKS